MMVNQMKQNLHGSSVLSGRLLMKWLRKSCKGCIKYDRINGVCLLDGKCYRGSIANAEEGCEDRYEDSGNV